MFKTDKQSVSTLQIHLTNISNLFPDPCNKANMAIKRIIYNFCCCFPVHTKAMLHSAICYILLYSSKCVGALLLKMYIASFKNTLLLKNSHYHLSFQRVIIFWLLGGMKYCKNYQKMTNAQSEQYYWKNGTDRLVQHRVARKFQIEVQ